MKKVLLIIGLLMLPVFLCGGGCVFMFVGLNRAAESKQREFFEQVAGGDAEAIYASLGSELREEIELPVFEAWIERINSELGGYQGIGVGFNTSIDNDLSTYQATANFESGTADSSLTYRDGQLVGFDIQSLALEGPWAEGKVDPSIYKERTIEFYNKFLTEDVDDSYNMFHEAFRDEVSLEEFQKMAQTIRGGYGEFSNIEVLDHEFSTDEYDGVVLRVRISATGENAKGIGMCRFNLVGMKFVMLEFEIDKAPPVDRARRTQ